MGFRAEGDKEIQAWVPLRCPKCYARCALFGFYILEESAKLLAKGGEKEHAIPPTPLVLRCQACGVSVCLPNVAWDGSFEFGDTICDFGTPGSSN